MKDSIYFSHDAGARNDPKILAMRSVYGSEGYGWFWIIVEMMREQSDYRIALGKYTSNALAMQMQCTPDAAHKFVSDCIQEFGLFTSDGEFFWSESLLKRMEKKDEKRRKAQAAARARWGNDETENDECDENADAMQTHSDRNANKRKESKEVKIRDIGQEAPSDIPPYEEIVNLYHELCPSLPRIRKLTKDRKSSIRARWKEYGSIDAFREVFSKAEASQFLSGRSGKWTACDFEWLIRQSNMPKVLEGTYNRDGPETQMPGSPAEPKQPKKQRWNA